LGEHVRYAKVAANLYEFAPRDNCFATRGKCRKNKKRSRRAIVDDHRGFGTGQFTYQSFGPCSSFAAVAGRQVVFDRRITSGFNHCATRSLGQWRPSEICMNNYACCVYDSIDARPAFTFYFEDKPFSSLGEQIETGRTAVGQQLLP
jgi:hypothetical protein